MPNRPVRQIIKDQKVLTAPATISAAAAAKLMKRRRVGAVMVVSGNKLIGLFTERDALFRVIAAGLDPETTPLSAVMTSNLQTIGPDKPFGHALHMMYEGGFRHVPVVENGNPIGIVSARDALGSEMEQFESELETRQHVNEILG